MQSAGVRPQVTVGPGATGSVWAGVPYTVELQAGSGSFSLAGEYLKVVPASTAAQVPAEAFGA